MTADAGRHRPAGTAPYAPRAACRPGVRPKAVTGLALAVTVVAAPLLAACGTAAGHGSAASISKTCTLVAATLSDGPNPGADPVGYAEAQIGPLRQIHTSDPTLRSEIRDLASAYAEVFASDGKSGSPPRSVAAAAKKVNASCPGAAS
jgi:hypothetical protein